MRAIEINAMTDNQGHLKIDYQINRPDKKVRIIILMEEPIEYADDDESKWLNAISSNPAFNFLNEPCENIYTINDGEKFND